MSYNAKNMAIQPGICPTTNEVWLWKPLAIYLTSFENLGLKLLCGLDFCFLKKKFHNGMEHEEFSNLAAAFIHHSIPPQNILTALQCLFSSREHPTGQHSCWSQPFQCQHTLTLFPNRNRIRYCKPQEAEKCWGRGRSCQHYAPFSSSWETLSPQLYNSSCVLLLFLWIYIAVTASFWLKSGWGI